MQSLKRILRLFKKSSPNYPKGMNSQVDALSDLVVIGKNFISAPGSILLAHDASLITHTGKTRVEKTTIEDDVFVGANAVILPGAYIGKGCIIGAGAIVSGRFEPYSVIAGNPGKVIMSVDEYVKKCEAKDVLYDLPKASLKKHGSGIRYTQEEAVHINSYVMEQFNAKTQKAT